MQVSWMWQAVPAWSSWGGGVGLSAPAPPRLLSGSDTWSAPSSDRFRLRATWRRSPGERGQRSVPNEEGRERCDVRLRSRPARASSAEVVVISPAVTHAYRSWPGRFPGPGRPRPLRAPEPLRSLPSSIVPVARRALQGDPQERGDFFLDIDDRLCPLELLLQAPILALQFEGTWIQLRRLRPTPLASQDSLGALSAPESQVGGVEPFPAQERSDLTWLSARIGLAKYRELVVGGEATTSSLGRHLRIRHKTGTDGRDGGRCLTGCWHRGQRDSRGFRQCPGCACASCPKTCRPVPRRPERPLLLPWQHFGACSPFHPSLGNHDNVFCCPGSIFLEIRPIPCGNHPEAAARSCLGSNFG